MINIHLYTNFDQCLLYQLHFIVPVCRVTLHLCSDYSCHQYVRPSYSVHIYVSGTLICGLFVVLLIFQYSTWFTLSCNSILFSSKSLSPDTWRVYQQSTCLCSRYSICSSMITLLVACTSSIIFLDLALRTCLASSHTYQFDFSIIISLSFWLRFSTLVSSSMRIPMLILSDHLSFLSPTYSVAVILKLITVPIVPRT